MVKWSNYIQDFKTSTHPVSEKTCQGNRTNGIFVPIFTFQDYIALLILVNLTPKFANKIWAGFNILYLYQQFAISGVSIYYGDLYVGIHMPDICMLAEICGSLW